MSAKVTMIGVSYLLCLVLQKYCDYCFIFTVVGGSYFYCGRKIRVTVRGSYLYYFLKNEYLHDVRRVGNTDLSIYFLKVIIILASMPML